MLLLSLQDWFTSSGGTVQSKTGFQTCRGIPNRFHKMHIRRSQILYMFLQSTTSFVLGLFR